MAEAGDGREAVDLARAHRPDVAKHAPDAAVTVRLGSDSVAGEALITVVDAVPGRPPPGATSGGYGPISLDERVRLAGGRMHAHPVDGGYTVTARLPLTSGAAAAPPGPQQTRASERELAAARRKVRRSVIDAVWIPVAAISVLLLLMFGFDLDDGDPPLLDAKVYQELRIGQNQSSVESRLAPHQFGDGRPEGVPAYRLCFADGRLIRKERVELGRQRRPSVVRRGPDITSALPSARRGRGLSRRRGCRAGARGRVRGCG